VALGLVLLAVTHVAALRADVHWVYALRTRAYRVTDLRYLDHLWQSLENPLKF